MCEAYHKAKKYEQVATLGQELLRQYPLSDRAFDTTLSSLPGTARRRAPIKTSTLNKRQTPPDSAYAPGATEYYTTYDSLGRTLSVTQPAKGRP